MADSILTAVVCPVQIGNVEIEGLFLSSGEYAVAFAQLQHLNLIPPNRSLKQLESLLDMTFQSHRKAKTSLHPKAVNVISLDELTAVIIASAKTGNESAQVLRDGLVGLSLRQLFADAFGEKFEKEDRQNWLKTRMAGKVTRRGLTEAIKDWYERNPGGTSRPPHAMFAQTTNLIYKALWGMEAVQLEKHLGCGRHESRNFMDEKSLKLLDRAEGNVMDFIDEDNIKPVDAVPMANIRKAKALPLRNS